MKSIIFTIVVLFVVLFLASCAKNSKEEILAQLDPCDTTSIGYALEIKPILDQFCNSSGCHNSTSIAGGYNFENYASVKSAALGTRFLGTINHSSGFSPMPKGGDKLTACQISKIEIWVRDGAQNN